MKEKKEKIKIEEIKKQLGECQKLKEEYLNGWKKAQANFLNYKKEEGEKISELMKYAGEEFILKLLPILDNIDIAEKKIPKELKDNQWVEGILTIKTQVLDFLKKEGVKEIESLGKKFDPNFQEVVEEVKKPDCESGIVIEEVKRGYLLHNKVIRPAKVKITE